MNALAGKPLPVYGDGLYVRDWIHVEDHCRAVLACALHGASGETYCIGADNEQPNLAVVRRILALTGRNESLITYVKDRPGHDRRYAIDSTKIRTQLGWAPRIGWEEGLQGTVEWYRQNTQWLESVRQGEFGAYYARRYGA
jgi:dTDP-glucose 4,6-dehydratase